jgi:hypothetical protein
MKCTVNVTGGSLSLFLGLTIPGRHVEGGDIVCGSDVTQGRLQ